MSPQSTTLITRFTFNSIKIFKKLFKSQLSKIHEEKKNEVKENFFGNFFTQTYNLIIKMPKTN